MKSRTENGRGSDRGADLSRRSFLAGTTGALFASSMTGVLVVGCGEDESAGGAPGLEEVTFLTIIPLNLGFVCEILGDINGHFKKEGLKVGIQSTRGSAPAIQSILQGSALLTRAGAIETVIAVAEQGAPLVNIGMQWHKSPIAITSADEAPLETPADFRGKKIGIPSEGGTSEITIDLLLASQQVPLGSVKRQVTGFSPGTFALVEKGRIDGYVIGSVEQVIFEQQIPKATVLDPSKYVEEGQCYLTSRRSLQEQRGLLQGYMAAIRAGMEDVLNDREKGFANIIKAVRAKHDFPELEQDSIAKGVMEQQVDAWFYAGEENMLKTVPENWQKVYDQLTGVGQAPKGKDPQQWFTNDLVS